MFHPESTRAEPSWLVAGLRGLPAFKGPATASTSNAGVRLLHLNESAYPPSPRIAEAIAGQLVSLNRYPDVYGTALANELSARTGIDADRIVFGCGSEELISALCAVSVSPGDSVVVPAPSFPAFAMATRLRGGRPLRARLDSLGANDPAALLAVIDDRTRIVFCCTPNPPSGGLMTEEALRHLIGAVPPEIILVVDEAYCEFARYAGGPDVLAMMKARRGDWAVLRTFSKAYGLAGTRIGYALCSSDEIVDALRKAKLQYGTTILSQVAALAALQDDGHLASTVSAIVAERENLSAELKALRLAPWPSAANFVSARMPVPALQAMEMLRERGILVRDWRDPEFRNEIRITVGRREDTTAIISALSDILADAARAA